METLGIIDSMLEVVELIEDKSESNILYQLEDPRDSYIQFNYYHESLRFNYSGKRGVSY